MSGSATNERFDAVRFEQRLQRRLRKSAMLARPVVLRGLLDDADVASVFAYAREIQSCLEDGTVVIKKDGDDESWPPDPAADEREDDEDGVPADGDESTDHGEEEAALEPGSDAWLAEQMRLSRLMDPQNFDLASQDPAETPAGESAADENTFADYRVSGANWVRLSESHRKYWLHHGGVMRDGVWRSFAEVCPMVHFKLTQAMLDSGLQESVWRCADIGAGDGRRELSVRCVEFHEYSAGGDLTDPGHIDVGSALTLSVQLSESLPRHCGGRFTTTDPSGTVVVHELERGDAIVFCSESVHNVQKLTCGIRNSLVVEMWADGENWVDRHH